jgi:hypothetical protein
MSRPCLAQRKGSSLQRSKPDMLHKEAQHTCACGACVHVCTNPHERIYCSGVIYCAAKCPNVFRPWSDNCLQQPNCNAADGACSIKLARFQTDKRSCWNFKRRNSCLTRINSEIYDDADLVALSIGLAQSRCRRAWARPHSMNTAKHLEFKGALH